MGVEVFGRATELADVHARVVAGCRLVTVVGPGGVGKTTLATAAMGALEALFPGRGHVVDLSRIDRPDAVAGALAAQLGFSSFEGLVESSTETPALVLVDNCEHVLDAAGEAIGRLLERCDSPAVLATSRSPLNLAGELVVVLAPLDVPEPGTADGTTSAVQMFCDRARHAGVNIDADDLAVVGDLCRRLDGLPLAIEIAAARTRSLAVGDILGRLQLPAGGPDDVADLTGRRLCSTTRRPGRPPHRPDRRAVVHADLALHDEAVAVVEAAVPGARRLQVRRCAVAVAPLEHRREQS